jgi:hypothetical protein
MTQWVEISREVRQGYPLPPTLFSVDINEILLEWNTNNVQGMQLTRNKEVKIIFFCRWSGKNSRSWNFVTEMYKQLESITSKYGLKISTSKTKTTAF